MYAIGKTLFKYFLLCLLLPAFLSCASIAYNPEDDPRRQSEGPSEQPSLSSLQSDLVNSAEWALGRENLVVNGRKFNLDCTGVVLAVYYRSGIDLTRNLGSYSGGGVQRLNNYLKDLGLLYNTDTPSPGDLLFWDNTYDKNNDGRTNDELTHVGMVVSSDRDGNIQYIHHNYREGIVKASMNLKDPDNMALNTPIRARDAEPGHAPKWLSSHLLRESGKAYKIPAE